MASESLVTLPSKRDLSHDQPKFTSQSTGSQSFDLIWGGVLKAIRDAQVFPLPTLTAGCTKFSELLTIRLKGLTAIPRHHIQLVFSPSHTYRDAFGWFDIYHLIRCNKQQ
jgi:hypothetical protein